MKVLLLCAGFGTRLGPVARGRPKALLPVAGRPLIEHLVDDLHQTGRLEELLVVTNELFAEQFQNWARGLAASGIRSRILSDGATANENRLGAARDLALAVESFGVRGPLLVAAGDNLFAFPVERLLADFEARPRVLVLATRESDPARLRRTGVAEVDAGGRLIRLHEKPENPPSDLSCPALYIFTAEALDLLPRFLDEAPDTDAPGHFIAWLAQRHEVFTHQMDGERLDVGDPDGYRAATAWLQARRPGARA
jgi:glucose-1-phosphate thymidylyltransferase